jgi:hypothetical protein
MHPVVVVPILPVVVVVAVVVVLVIPILPVVVEGEEAVVVVGLVGPVGSNCSVVVVCLRVSPILPAACPAVVVPSLPVGHLQAIGHRSYHKIWHRDHFQRRSWGSQQVNLHHRRRKTFAREY